MNGRFAKIAGEFQRSWPAATAALLAVSVYARSFTFDFVNDDQMQIVGNQWLRSWHYVPRFFTGQVWAFANGGSSGNYWRPLFLLWLRLNYATFKLDPLGWHVVNVLVHAVVVAAAYVLAYELSQKRVLAFVSSAIFAVNPVTIETVTWLSGVTDSLAALGMIATLIFWIRSNESSHYRRALQIASLVAFAAGLLCKETAIITPCLILVLAYMETSAPALPPAKRLRRALCSVMPFLMVVVLYFVARLAALHTLYPYVNHSLRGLAFTWPSLLLFYLWKLVVPIGISPGYDLKPLHDLTVSGVVVPFLILIAIALCGFFLLRKLMANGPARSQSAKFVAVAIALVVLPILPALNTRALSRFDLAHTRYLYVPCIGFAMLVSAALERVRLMHRRGGLFQAGMAFVIIAALAELTVVQQSYWRDDQTLLARGSAIAPSNAAIKVSLGVELANAGSLADAEAMFLEAIRLEPDEWDAYKNLGNTYLMDRQYQRAEIYYQQAVQMSPERTDAIQALAWAQMKEGKLGEAEASIHVAMRVNPHAENNHYVLGQIFEAQGNVSSAVEQYRLELAASPGHTSSLDRLSALRANH